MSSRINVNVVVNQVKLKEKIIEFLDQQGFLESVKLNCVTFHSKINKNHLEPFDLNLILKFPSIEDGKVRILLKSVLPQQFLFA